MCFVLVAFLSQEEHIFGVGRTLLIGAASEGRLGAWMPLGRKKVQQGGDTVLGARCKDWSGE